jgi:catechol 2,3-dioxygenase-like lactoylglutathione lyase family enzyme
MISAIKGIKTSLVGFALLFITEIGFAQSELPDPEGSFIAIIVSKMDVSISWYQDVLGFKRTSYVDVPERGFKQANLSRGMMDIELIELNVAITQDAALTNHPTATRIQGLFKVGFQVNDFDGWLLHLTNSKVEFGGSVVTDSESGKRMLIIKDPDGNRIQFFER